MEDVIKRLLKEIEEGDTVLDVGCGDGSLIKDLEKRKDIKIMGTDPFPSNWECYNFLAEEIEEIGENFDVIYLVKSFHHIQKPELFLKSAKKVLKNNGKLIILDWKYGIDTGIKERYYRVEEIVNMLNKYGFNIVKKEETQEIVFVVARV